METTSVKKPIIGMRGLALFLGVHYNTVYNWHKEGLLKYKKIKGTFIFDSEDYLKDPDNK